MCGCVLCTSLFNADVHRLNTCRLNRFCGASVHSCFLGATVKRFRGVIEPLCFSEWSSLAICRYHSVCLCRKKKGGITEINSTDVIGKTAVNYGEAVMERLYTCGTKVAQNRNYLKLNVSIPASRENEFWQNWCHCKKPRKIYLCASVWIGRNKASKERNLNFGHLIHN